MHDINYTICVIYEYDKLILDNLTRAHNIES